MNTLFFVGLAIFFVVFLWGLLRKPATRGESFFDLFAFWTWFEHDEQVRIGRLVLTLTGSAEWFGFFSKSHDGQDGFPKYKLLRLTAFKRHLIVVLWGKK